MTRLITLLATSLLAALPAQIALPTQSEGTDAIRDVDAPAARARNGPPANRAQKRVSGMGQDSEVQ